MEVIAFYSVFNTETPFVSQFWALARDTLLVCKNLQPTKKLVPSTTWVVKFFLQHKTLVMETYFSPPVINNYSSIITFSQSFIFTKETAALNNWVAKFFVPTVTVTHSAV